jgi:hypothetical protein
MKKALIFVCLTAVVSFATAGAPKKLCQDLPSGLVFSAPLTIAEIERRQLKEINQMLKLRPDIPKVPFGFSNADWIIFKKKVRPGDRIVQYSTDERSFQNLAGEAGYAIIRHNCLVDTLVTARN